MKVLLTILVVANVGFSQGRLHSKLEIKATEHKNNQKEIVFTVTPDAGMKINFDDKKPETVPWQLEIKNPQGLKVPKLKLEYADFDRDKGQFRFVAANEGKVPERGFDYRLVAFVCTQDKSQCFRDVFKASWVLPK